MITAILTLLAALLPSLLDAWQQSAAKKRKEQPSDDATAHIQQARQTLAQNDGAAFDAAAAEQHDRVSEILATHRGGRG